MWNTQNYRLKLSESNDNKRKNMKDKKENSWRNEEKAFSGSDEPTFRKWYWNKYGDEEGAERIEQENKKNNRVQRKNVVELERLWCIFFFAFQFFGYNQKKNPTKYDVNAKEWPNPNGTLPFNAWLFHLRLFDFWSSSLRFHYSYLHLPYIVVFVPYSESILHFYCCLLGIWIIAWSKTRNIQPQRTCIVIFIISRSTEREFRRRRRRKKLLRTQDEAPNGIYICHVYGQICVWTANTSKNDRRRRRRPCLAVISTCKNSIQCSNKPKNQSLDAFNMTWSIIINHIHLRTILENWCCWWDIIWCERFVCLLWKPWVNLSLSLSL